MFYKILRPFMYVAYKIFFRVTVFDKENLIQDGKSIVVCNHLGKADVLLIGSVYKGKTYFLAKKEWYNNKIVAWFLKKLGSIPIDRDNPSLQSVKEGLKVLKDEKRLGIFPEGTRNKKDNTLQDIKTGTALFAIKGKSKIVPIIIHSKISPFKRNYAMVGKPFELTEFYDKKFSEDVANEATLIIKQKMLEVQGQLFDKVDKIKGGNNK